MNRLSVKLIRQWRPESTGWGRGAGPRSIGRARASWPPHASWSPSTVPTRAWERWPNERGCPGSRFTTSSARKPAGTQAVESGADPADDLRRRIEQACAAWAANPRLYRQLAGRDRPDHDHALAERLAAADRLRPGCSIKEAEDVIGILTSFPVFDRLHKEGRRTPSVVAQILLRMASGLLASGAQEVTS